MFIDAGGNNAIISVSEFLQHIHYEIYDLHDKRCPLFI